MFLSISIILNSLFLYCMIQMSNKYFWVWVWVWARIGHVTERVEKIMGRWNGGTILVHVGTNNADKEGTTAIVDKYRNLLKKTKEARVRQIILSGILPVFGKRIDGYRHSKRLAINGMMKRLCKERWIRGSVWELCGKRRNVREGRSAP